MKRIDVDGLKFDFPDEWEVDKFDDWAFCKRFQNIVPKTGAVDILAVSPEIREHNVPKTLWLIEVKDYRFNIREDSSTLDEVMGEKVRGTLASLLPAKLDAHDADQRRLAGKALTCRRIRIFLHLEQPRLHSAYAPRGKAINRANVLMDMTQRVRHVDPHPKIVDMHSTDLDWTVTP